MNTPAFGTDPRDVAVTLDHDSGPDTCLALASCTSVGRVRDINEDRVLVLRGADPEHECLIAIADGMGGHEHGEVASGVAADVLGKAYLARELRDAPSISAVFDRIDAAIHAEAGGGGTTLVMAMICPGHLTVASVGDSRAYCLRDAKLSRLTTDDSWVESMVRAGRLLPEEARTHPRRNVLLRALGPGNSEGAQVATPGLNVGDVVMVCSDGLHGTVDDQHIERILACEVDAEKACARLVKAALKGGGPDNISVAICTVRSS